MLKDSLLFLIKKRLRYITPLECERAQTVPEGYTEGVSKSQRYKMLGNGWTVDVISHILSFMEKENTYEAQNEIHIDNSNTYLEDQL